MARDRHFDNLEAAVRAYGQQVGGFGSVTVRITFNEGLPIQLDVLERQERCRLDRQDLRLTGAPRPATIAPD